MGGEGERERERDRERERERERELKTKGEGGKVMKGGRTERGINQPHHHSSTGSMQGYWSSRRRDREE